MDFAARVAKVQDQVIPLGGRVVSYMHVDDWPISIDGEHTPLFDVPDGWFIVSRTGTVVANVHRALMDYTIELSEQESAWVYEAMAAMCREQVPGGYRVVLSLPVGSIDRLRMNAKPFQKYPHIDAGRIKETLRDLAALCEEAGIDLSDVPAYLVRSWSASHGQRAWEVHVAAPGGGLTGFRIPQCLVRDAQAEVARESLRSSSQRA